jgi:LysM repeat protein
MSINILYRITACCLLLFLFAGCVAQQKSTNVQTIDGKKYYIHKIEKKQSLYSLSKLYNVSLDEIYQLNPGIQSGVKVNQEIKIPYASTPPVASATVTPAQPDTNKYLTYRSGKGETLYSISKKFNVTEKQLLAWNPSLSQGLKEGQLIIVGEKPKKKKDIKEQKPVYTVAEDPQVSLFDSTLFKPVSKPKKNAYNIALILPFKLDETAALDPSVLYRNNQHYPTVPALAANFYLGFKAAVDSLAGKDFALNLELYDADEKDSLKLTQFANDAHFSQTDLIFGPLYTSGFKIISKKAAELHVPVVSPITQQNKILYNNIYISKTTLRHLHCLKAWQTIASIRLRQTMRMSSSCRFQTRIKRSRGTFLPSAPIITASSPLPAGRQKTPLRSPVTLPH